MTKGRIYPPHELALRWWYERPLPRPPMTDVQACAFAADWPSIIGRPVCNLCSKSIRGREAKVIAHLNTEHPDWLKDWNEMLRKQGVIW